MLSKSFYLLVFLFLNGCDEIVENTNTNPIPVGYELNSTNKDSNISDSNTSKYIPIKSYVTDDPKSTQKCSDTPESELVGAAAVLNDSIDLSSSLILTANNLLSLSYSISSSGEYANSEYMKAMLGLSKDIAIMAGRIGEMSDRILVMSDKILVMSDRIVKTKKIQDKNVELTKKSALKAEENFMILLK
jgi:hypothetical protein